MTCELCGLELQPADTRIIPAVDRDDLGIKGEEMKETDYFCCNTCWHLWESL